MDSSASYDISSSAAEFLEKEKLCKELCQNINEGVTQPGSISISTPRDLTRTPDEEISDLLKQMNQLLSPRERDVIRSSEEKSVENLLKEAEELIRSSTPLFLNMTFDSSEKSLKSPAKDSSNNNNVPHIATPKKTKSVTPAVEKETTAVVVHQTEDIEEVVNKKSEDDRNNNKSDVSKESDRIIKENNNRNLKKDTEKANNNNNNNKNVKIDIEVNGNNKNETDELSKTNSICKNESNQLSSATTNNSQQIVSSNPLLEYNNQLFKEIGDKRKKRQSPVVTNTFKKSTKEIQNAEKLTLSDLATPVASGHSAVMRTEANKRGSPLKSKEITPGSCCEEQKKKNMELEKIRKNYEEKIFDLEQQINILNAKLKDYEYEALKVTANINESTKNHHQIELLETELRTQEQLIAGYQRENHKLCQEISACKA